MRRYRLRLGGGCTRGASSRLKRDYWSSGHQKSRTMWEEQEEEKEEDADDDDDDDDDVDSKEDNSMRRHSNTDDKLRFLTGLGQLGSWW